MKQYQLKITWTNGDTEYIGCEDSLDGIKELRKRLINDRAIPAVNDMMAYDIKHIRKWQIEEAKRDK